MPFDVFISHSSHDKRWVETLAHNLQDAQLRVFFDKWSITPGQSFVQELDRGLERAEKVESRSLVSVSKGRHVSRL